jgi:hypothetical protein
VSRRPAAIAWETFLAVSLLISPTRFSPSCFIALVTWISRFTTLSVMLWTICWSVKATLRM